MRRFAFVTLFLLGVTFSSVGWARTLTVASNGTDSSSCGQTSTPCRSISQAIRNAANGDIIVVGPGEYGNLEFGAVTGCCAIVVDKAVSITARDGASATVINMRDTGRWPVTITASNVVFGGKNHGFMIVADTNPPFSGIFVKEGTTAVTVQGHTVVGFGRGIDIAGDNGLIANNVVIENDQGLNIHGNNNTATENVANGNPGGGGIWVGGTQQIISKNICNANTFTGIRVREGAGHQIIDNSAIGNGNEGISLDSGTSAVATGNTFFATASNCGFKNNNNVGIVATGNFWGAATGPGPDPADNVCNIGAATTDTSNFLHSVPTPSTPDLVVTYVSPPANAPISVVSRGGNFLIQDYTKNIGTADAQGSTTQYYFSLDTVKDNTDVLLGGRNVSSLAQGASSGGAATVNVPVNLATGNYFVIACANNTQTVIESNETNNCSFSGSLITIK